MRPFNPINNPTRGLDGVHQFLEGFYPQRNPINTIPPLGGLVGLVGLTLGVWDGKFDTQTRANPTNGVPWGDGVG